jgi:hypothetical protein
MELGTDRDNSNMRRLRCGGSYEHSASELAKL